MRQPKGDAVGRGRAHHCGCARAPSFIYSPRGPKQDGQRHEKGLAREAERRVIKGIGVDTIELERIARVYRRYNERFLDRIFAPEERAYALRYKDPVPRLAARFAAKEACMKALGTGWNFGVRWRDIVVVNDQGGKPELKLHGRAKTFFEQLSANRIHLSITHSREHATAIVVFE
jgi:holo-[acyl-carrier protein] synthase